MKYYDKNAKFIRTSILSSFPHPLRSLRHAGLYFQERSFCMKTPNSEVEKLTLKVKYLTEQIKTLTRVPRECWAQLHKGLNQDEFKDIFPYHIYARAKLPTPNKMFTQIDLHTERLQARKLVELYATGNFEINKNSHTCCVLEVPMNTLKTYVTDDGTNHTYVYTSSSIEDKQLYVMPHDAPVIDHEAIADQTRLRLVHLLFPWICDKTQHEKILKLNRILGNKSKSGCLIYAINRLNKHSHDRITMEGRKSETYRLINEAQNLLDDYDAWKKHQLNFIRNYGFPDQPLATAEHKDLSLDKRGFKGQLPYNHSIYLRGSPEDICFDINKIRTLLHDEFPDGKIKKLQIYSNDQIFNENTAVERAQILGLYIYLRDILDTKLWYHGALHNKYAVKWYQQEWEKTIDDFFNFDDLDQFGKYSK